MRPQPLFSSLAHWIWDHSDRFGYNYYLRAERSFKVSESAHRQVQTGSPTTLRITADANYQVWLNGCLLGHGPAKSPENERFIDTYDLSATLVAGENLLEVLVLSVGVGTMSYVCGEAGLIFQVDGPGLLIGSDADTMVQRDPQRLQPSTRRWILPCIEDVHAKKKSSRWSKARIVEKVTRLLPRPVPLPSRQPVCAKRVISADTVRLPTFATTFRIKPYLVPPEEADVTTVYERNAFFITDIVSRKKQQIVFTPTPGQVTWYFKGRKIITGSGWGLWDPATQIPTITLEPGPNRLIGVHGHNFFEDIHLAGFTEDLVEFRNPYGRGGFQVALPRVKNDADRSGGVATSALEGASSPERVKLPPGFAHTLASCDFPKMDRVHTLAEANFQSLAVGGQIDETQIVSKSGIAVGGSLRLPSAAKGSATRVVIDLGVIHNGWLSFSVHGKSSSRLIFSCFEGLKSLQPLDFHWPEACNNALSYRLRDGWQDFESFLPIGVRYIAIFHEGATPVDIRDLAIRSANCGQLSQGAFLSDDLTLNAIYAMCEQTVISATDDTLTDCPTYEAVNWNFDNRLGAMADLVTGRNWNIISNTLEHYARDPRYPGLVRSHYPSTWDIRIPVFSFQWILACLDFFQNTEDVGFVKRMMPTIAAGLDEAIGLINPNGLLAWPGGKDVWHIIDWHKSRDDGHAIVSAEQGVLLGALHAGIVLARVANGKNWKSQAKRWEHSHETLKASIEKHLWVKERDAFADSIHADGTISPVSSQPSNAALALHGVGSAAWRTRLANRLEKPDDSLLPFGSPMGLFYILELLDQQGKVHAIFQIIRDNWIPMLEAGDGTAWEHFIDYGFPGAPTRSRCHPFATYILKYFVKYLMGLEATRSGDSSFRFAPNPPGGINSCQGVLATSHGDIRVSWEIRSGSFKKNIHAPKSITILRS